MATKELTYRMQERGINSLSDCELLEITTQTSKPDKLKTLLSSFNYNLREIAKLNDKELIKAGLTQREANILMCALEIGRRNQSQEVENRFQVKQSKDMFDLFSPLMSDLVHEEFWVVFLNRQNKIMGKMKLSQGGISGTVTDVRIVMKRAIEYLASGIIVAHNHPSGNLQPSESDTRITQKIKEAGNIMDIQLLDHIIIGDKDYYSFADNGIL
jgi:DNA repair protein RadC